MPEQFIPLAPAESVVPSADQTAFRLKVLPQAQAEAVGTRSGFQTLAQAHLAGQPKTCAQPKVTVQREGDRVSCIQIQCTCGRTVELVCDY